MERNGFSFIKNIEAITSELSRLYKMLLSVVNVNTELIAFHERRIIEGIFHWVRLRLNLSVQICLFATNNMVIKGIEIKFPFIRVTESATRYTRVNNVKSNRETTHVHAFVSVYKKRTIISCWLFWSMQFCF